MNNDIKVLLFDLCGVVIGIDPKKAISELKKISSMRQLLNLKNWTIDMKLLTLIYLNFLMHMKKEKFQIKHLGCLLYTSPSPRDRG